MFGAGMWEQSRPAKKLRSLFLGHIWKKFDLKTVLRSLRFVVVVVVV